MKLEIEEGGLNTIGMLEEGFFKEYSKGGGKISQPSKSNGALNAPVNKSKAAEANTETLLLRAYDVRDSLISSFSEVKLGSNLADNMRSAINKIGDMIVEMGGASDKFDPLAHISGLGAPSIGKYASRVIENTIDSYSLGKIEDAKISENGKSVIITFAGSFDKTQYKAVGTITTNGTWLGNEAIDYVYSPGAGKMSVKVANQDGQWIDKSDNYSVSWELFEGDGKEENNIKKSSEIKEEETKLAQNNLDSDINIDFPIEEK